MILSQEVPASRCNLSLQVTGSAASSMESRERYSTASLGGIEHNDQGNAEEVLNIRCCRKAMAMQDAWMTLSLRGFRETNLVHNREGPSRSAWAGPRGADVHATRLAIDDLGVWPAWGPQAENQERIQEQMHKDQSPSRTLAN